MPHIARGSLTLLLLVASASVLPAQSSDLITRIRSVEHDGAGHVEARAAVRALAGESAAVLPEILAALKDANPLAANWLRGAFETIAARTLAAGEPLPKAELLDFFNGRANDPRARRLAYEWIVRIDPDAAVEIVPQSLDDPSAEMRRDAVARLLEQAANAKAAGRDAEAVELYQQALSGANEAEQVDPILKSLKELGRPVSSIEHYGLITGWHAIGPFDNREMAGFDVAYPPEDEIDLDAKYDGQLGEVGWQELAAQGDEGEFDLAKLTAPHKGAIDYVTTVFHSDADRPVEFRLATANAWKLWVNGELVFAREEYHRGCGSISIAFRVCCGRGRIAFSSRFARTSRSRTGRRSGAFSSASATSTDGR
ncbi:MAG: hypothetical protein R3B90_04150 [Planctomycetaceae bacterium]